MSNTDEQIIVNGKSDFGITAIVVYAVAGMWCCIILTAVITKLFRFDIDSFELIIYMSIILIPVTVYLFARFTYFKFSVTDKFIRITFPVSKIVKEIPLSDISYVKFSNYTGMYGPVGGILKIYDSKEKYFGRLMFHDSSSFPESQNSQLIIYLYKNGISIEFGTTWKEYSYYINYLKKYAG